MRHGGTLAMGVVAVTALGCQPRFERPASLIEGLRILAVVVEPPESAPAARVRGEVLAVGPAGRILDPSPTWALCTRRPPIAAYNSVSDACSFPTDGALTALGAGPSLDFAIPGGACTSFGSETPPATADGQRIRPVDPDATGGYYQPIRVDVGAQVAFGGPRITCALARASADATRSFRDQYRSNRNPELPALDLPSRAPRGSRLRVAARVSEGSRERYVVYDPRAGAIEERTEILEAQFFATAGLFSNDSRTGDGELAEELTLPNTQGPQHVWVVVRDNRGGAAFRGHVVEVE